MMEIRLQPVVNLPVVVAVTAVLLGLLWVRPRHVQLARRQWAALIGLRLVVVLLMLFALLRPSFVYMKAEPVAASLVMLVDGSRSMQVADSLGDKPRWDSVRRLLGSSANDIDKLNKKLNVAAYEFDSQTRKFRPERQDWSAGCAERRRVGNRGRDQRCAGARDEQARAGDASVERRCAAGNCAARCAAAGGCAAAVGREYSPLHIHVRQVGRPRAGRFQPSTIW